MPISQQRRAEALRQDRLIQSAAAPLRRAIAQEKNIYIRQCAEAWRNTRSLRDDDYFAHEKRVKSILYKYYVATGRMMNGEISSQIKAQKPTLELKRQSKFEYNLLRWAGHEAGRKAKPIAGTTQKDINNAVQRAYLEEEPESVVISSILATRGYSAFRADAIARTETHNAAMYASLETTKDFAAEESVTMKKIWSPTVDDRSREYHAAMEDYGSIAMEDYFDVENPKGGTDSMISPGDQNAPAEQVINCRCVLTYEVQ